MVAPASTVDTVAIERRLERLKDLYQDGDLSRADYLKKRDSLRAQLQQAAPPIIRPDLSRALHLLGDMPALLTAAPAQQRALLRDIFARFYLAWDGIKAITPTSVYSTLIEVMASEDGVADGTRTHNNRNHNPALCH